MLQFCKVPSISGMIRDKKRCVCVCCFSCFGNLLCLDNFSSIHFCLCGIRVVTRTRGKDLKTSWHQEKHHEFMVYAEAHQGRYMVFGTSTGILDLQPSRHSSICKKHHKYVWILNTFLTYTIVQHIQHIYIYIHRYVHHHVYLCIFIYHVILGQIIADQFLTIWPDSQPGKTAPQPEVSYLQPSKDDGGTCAVQTNSFIIHQTGRKYGEDRNFVKFVEMYQVQIWRCFQFSVFLVSRVVLIRVPSDMLQTLGDRCSTRRAQTFGVPTHGTNGLQPLGPQPSHPA